MQKTYRGGAMPLALIAVIVVIVAGAMLFGRGESVTTIADDAVQVAKDKGIAALDEQGAEVIEKSKAMIEEGKEKAMDTAVEEGKKVVGEAMKEVGEKMMEEPGEPGVFEDYAAEKIAANDGAILDFAAPWCPSCRAFEKNVTSNLDKIPSGVAILKVDYDTETDLKKKYGVTQQHTFVQVDNDGNLIKKWVGSPTIDHVVASMEA